MLCPQCRGVGELADGHECGACDGAGHNPDCPCGLSVVQHPLDGWQHADGSISHDGPWYGHSVAELMRRAGARFVPHERLFGRTYGLDVRLFEGERLRPDIRTYVMVLMDSFWGPRYGPSWVTWARVYLAGSEASEWTSAQREGNNDFDVLVGVDYDRCREEVPALAQLSDLEITDRFNHEFREELQPRTQPVWIPVRMHVGDMERSSSWRPRSSYLLTTQPSSSPTTTPDLPPARSSSGTRSTSRQSVGTSNWQGSPERCAGAAPAPSARSAGSAAPRPSRPRTAPAKPARPTTSATATSGSTTASPPSGSTRSSRSKMVDAASVDEARRTASSAGPSTMITDAVPASAPVGSASAASSASGATTDWATSVSPIFAPQSTGWTAASPPPPPDGWIYIGPFDNTVFCNPDSYDIRDIKPYAAYDITRDMWSVRPPHLPDWSIEDFPQGHALIQECQGYANVIRSILRMPEPYRSQQADALWKHLHGDRSRAFGPTGEGWYDSGNVIEKFLDQAGLWEQLAQAHFDAVADPHKLLAPAGWSNDPR